MEKTRQYRLKVPGIHCAGCLRTVEAALKQVPGTEQVIPPHPGLRQGGGPGKDLR